MSDKTADPAALTHTKRPVTTVGSLTSAMLLMLLVICSPPADALAQTEEQFLEPQNMPSPTGISTVSKQYIPNGPYIYRLSDLSKSSVRAANPAPVELLRGHYPGGQKGWDGVVIGWNGDKHLTIGIPEGVPVLPGPERVGNVEIAYINYEPAFAKSVARRTEEVTLQNVGYTAQEAETSFHNVDCTIHLQGTDGTFFGTVIMDVAGHGVGTTRRDILGQGSVSLKFALSRLPGAQSPPLTPTQAMLADISPLNFPTIDHGPLQDGMSLDYGWFDFLKTQKVFDVLRHGNYSIHFNMTFGEQEISYVIREPISADAAKAYQRCEARTYIFPRLVEDSLGP